MLTTLDKNRLASALREHETKSKLVVMLLMLATDVSTEAGEDIAAKFQAAYDSLYAACGAERA